MNCLDRKKSNFNMKFPPASLITLLRLFRRDGVLFFLKCARYVFSKTAWCWLLRGGHALYANPSKQGTTTSKNFKALEGSIFYSSEWYLKNNPDVLQAGVDPVGHYLLHGREPLRNPGPDFIGDEYLAINQDVRDVGINPLVHFEVHGRRENRPISFLQMASGDYPSKAIEIEQTFPATPRRHGRSAVFAAHSGAASISESTLVFLRGLKEVVDDIVFVASNPILPEEIDKLEGLVRYAIFRDHHGYDFYSYKLGWQKAKELGLLEPSACDEVVVCNDSCYAPVFPFQRCFAEMATRQCDFWGLTANTSFVGREHLQSFFLVFRRSVLADGSLDRFMEGVERISNRWEVIRRYEVGLTNALATAGHTWDSLVPKAFAVENNVTPTKKPMALMLKYGMPLLKASAMKGDMKDDREEVLAFVRTHNRELAATIPSSTTPPDYNLPHRLREAHQAAFPEKIAAIRRDRVEKGHPVRALFLVFSSSMFPARPLLDAMLRDFAFDARILVIPDLRWRDRDPEILRRKCRDELSAFYPSARFVNAKPDESGIWPDVIGDFGADIVSYPSPYDLSAFCYNPHWAVGRNFLPIYISYSFSTSVHGYGVYGRQNYAYFWKVFVECEANAKEYAEHSILKGLNAECVGYFKMDALAKAKPWSRNGTRKRVLIAPHHSVEGGANDNLALSNFQRYADYFLALPEKHPELDFVFRPHPFLFTVLARKNKWGAEKVEAWITRMKAHPNVRWSDEGDYFPAFASCDAVVQDCGSYLAEWFYTGKPCCYMLKSPSDINAKFTPLGKECLSHSYIAYDEAAIEAFLNDVVVGGDDPKAAGRDEFRKTIMLNHPHAAAAALRSIKEALGILS